MTYRGVRIFGDLKRCRILVYLERWRILVYLKRWRILSERLLNELLEGIRCIPLIRANCSKIHKSIGMQFIQKMCKTSEKHAKSSLTPVALETREKRKYM